MNFSSKSQARATLNQRGLAPIAEMSLKERRTDLVAINSGGKDLGK